MDQFKIDSHKINYHISTLNNWLNKKMIYPIYVEVSPSGFCNHRCRFCALDYIAYQKRSINANLFKERLFEMSKLGVKSIMYAGEGEPLLHNNISEIIDETQKNGIDVAITTNGVLLSQSLSENILSHVEWIKVSINAGTADTYAYIHLTKTSDFEKVINNLSMAVKLKRLNHYPIVLGMQMVLLPENHHEAFTLAKLAKDIGVDYIVIKPFSQHLYSKNNHYSKISYQKYYRLSDELEELNDNSFNVIFRLETMKKWDKNSKPYTHCLALPFWSYIDAGGNVWGCSAYLENEKFRYGNIYENTFQEIWEGQKRKDSLYWVEHELNIEKCRTNCRMDNINRYLWDITHPPKHVNFI